MNKLGILLISTMVFVFTTTTCFSAPTLEQKQIVKNIYHNEFNQFVSNSYESKNNRNNYYLDENNNIKLNYTKMCKNIELEALKNGIKISVKPIIRNTDPNLKTSLIKYFEDKFNPLSRELPASNSKHLAGQLIFNGTGYAYTRFNKSEPKTQNYYEKVYIVSTIINVKSGFYTLFDNVNDTVEWKLIYVKQPYLSQNINLKLAELENANFEFDKAYKHYELAKNAPNANSVLYNIKMQENLIPNYHKVTANNNARAEYWKKVREQQEKSNHSINIMLNALETTSNTINETNRILAENTLMTAIATQNGYNTKKLNQQNKKNINSNTQVSYISDTAYRNQLNALQNMNNAYAERQALYRVKGNLMNLYNEEIEGATFRKNIDYEILKAEKDYNLKKKAFDNLISNPKHVEAVDKYINQNPEKSKTLTLGVREDKINPRYLKLKNKYGYYYQKDKNLYNK